MLTKFFRTVKGLIKVPHSLQSLSSDLKSMEEIKIQNGKLLSRLNRSYTHDKVMDLHVYEFKVFSQWGDDGIIQFLVDYLDIESKTFIEFGVQNYKEANTRFLLINNNWKGLIIDGSEDNIHQVQAEDIYWKYELTAVPAFITKDNINTILRDNGFCGEPGLLHIDIDGNDYWIWKEIDCANPVIVIVEYNSVFGPDHAWTIPYKKDFFRTNQHYSNLYFGASLLSLCDLAEEKGYYFVGCNSNGNNAYFVRKDRIKDLKPLCAREGYIASHFRESRDRMGKLSFVTGDNRLQGIREMEVFNTRTNASEKI